MKPRAHITVMAAVLAVTASSALAVDLFWQGGTAPINSANYTDGTNPNLVPLSDDWLYIGADGVATQSEGAFTFGRMSNRMPRSRQRATSASTCARTRTGDSPGLAVT